VLSGALYDERLGDHRRFGFPSDTAFTVARSDLWLGPPGGVSAPDVVAYEARAFGYRSLRLPLPEAPTRGWPLGWELYVDVRGSRARALAAELEAGWSFLAPLADRGGLADHALASFGLAYASYLPTAAAPARSTPRRSELPVALEARAALGARPSHRSWLSGRVAATPAAVFAGADRTLALELRAGAEGHVSLGLDSAAHDPALLFRADVLRTTLSFTGTGPETNALLTLGLDCADRRAHAVRTTFSQPSCLPRNSS
jgi:hypothetical protein